MKRQKSKSLLIALCVAAVILVLFTACVMRAYGSGKIPGGVTAGKVNISGLTVEEAAQKLRDTLKDSSFDTPVHLVFDDVEKSVIPADFLASYNYEKSAEKASLIFKNGNFLSRIGRAFCSFFVKQEAGMVVEYDEVTYNEVLKSLVADVQNRVVEHSWEIKDDVLVVTTGRPGLMPDDAAVSAAILDTIGKGTFDKKIVFKKESRNPTQLDAAVLHSAVCAEAADAYYEIVDGKVVIHPHVIGVSFDGDVAEGLIESNTGHGITFKIPLRIQEPSTTLEDIEEKLFSDVIGEYKTKFNTGDVPRSKNVALAANKINGTILAPGEIFSYNDVVGERSYSEGFETAGVYVNGETVQGIGGGICQVSSTLFNAVVLANLDIVERVNHQLTVSYVPLGRDATVDYGNIDFRFRNSTDYPVKIVCSAEGGVMYTAVYGHKEDESLEVSFETVTIGHTPPPERKVEDPTLPKGEEKVESEGTNGYVVDTYKIVTRDGQEPQRSYLCRSNYNGSFRIIHIGTGEAVPSPTPDETDEPSESDEPGATTQPKVTTSPSPSASVPPASGENVSDRPGNIDAPETDDKPENTDTLSDSGL